MQIMNYINNSKYKTELTHLEFNKEPDIGFYYLSAKYRIEDEGSIRELDFPVIQLPISCNHVAIGRDDGPTSVPKVDIGFGFMPLAVADPRGMIYFTEKVIKEKTHEMTLDEIEKKLGYKVKIVNK